MIKKNVFENLKKFPSESANKMISSINASLISYTTPKCGLIKTKFEQSLFCNRELKFIEISGFNYYFKLLPRVMI